MMLICKVTDIVPNIDKAQRVFTRVDEEGTGESYNRNRGV